MTRTFFVRKKKEYIQMQKEERKKNRGCRKTDRQLNIFSAFFALPTKILPMMCFCNNSFDLCLMNFFLYYLSGSSQILYLKYVLQRYYNDTPKSFVGKDFYKQRWHGEKLLPMMKMKITFVSLCSCTKAAQYFQTISPQILFSFF